MTTTQRGGGSLAGPIIKIALLGAGLALAIAAALPLVGAKAWGWLAVLAATTGLLFYIYLTPRHIAAKYLVPGTLFLLAFQVAPVLYTASTAFTNYLTKPDLQVALYQANPRPPALVAALDQVKGTDPDIQKWLDAGKGGAVLPAIPAMAAVWDPFGKAEAAIVGGADVQTTLAAAGKAITEAINK